MAEVRKKMRVRMAVPRKLGGTIWGQGHRLLTTTAYASVEGVIDYGLTVTRSAVSEAEFRQVDARVRNTRARQIAGVSPTTRREVFYAIADLRSAQNRYPLKTANLVDRALRGRGTGV